MPEALRDALASGPVVTGTLHPGCTVDAATARSAALTIAEHARESEVPFLLAALGITGENGPEDGKWAGYMYGRPGKGRGQHAC
jgi:hypothetical protein